VTFLINAKIGSRKRWVKEAGRRTGFGAQNFCGMIVMYDHMLKLAPNTNTTAPQSGGNYFHKGYRRIFMTSSKYPTISKAMTSQTKVMFATVGA